MHAPNTDHCFDAAFATQLTQLRDFLVARDFLDKDEDEIVIIQLESNADPNYTRPSCLRCTKDLLTNHKISINSN